MNGAACNGYLDARCVMWMLFDDDDEESSERTPVVGGKVGGEEQFEN